MTGAAAGTPLHPRLRRALRPIALLCASLVCAWIIVGLVGQIDWSAVVDAAEKLSLWQAAPLLLVLVIRQVLNAAPLAIFIRGLGLFHAVINDQAAILLSMIAPPPSDMVLRITMFNSWGVESSRGLAGAVMNTVSFYMIRFSAPVLAVLFVLHDRLEVAYVGAGLAGAAVAMSLLVGMRLIIARESTAAQIGLRAGRLVRRVRKNVDPESWADATTTFRLHVGDKIRDGLPRALVCLLAMILTDAFLLLLTLRFVGVSAGLVPAWEVFAAFLLAYPLTLLPVSGLGVLDAVILAALVEVGGIALEPALVAGLVVWRVVTLLTPLLMGAASIGYWRRSTAGGT